MFEKTLQDLVKGIRSHKADRSSYVSQAIGEIKTDLRSTDMRRKALAVQKATYLQMLGYDVSWAAFHIVEVMSAPQFQHKHIGMLAAQQTFHINTDVLLLCTNLLKKELGSKNPFESGVALCCIANVVTPDLARDLVDDVSVMLNSSNPFLRKKAILTLYKILLQYPVALKFTFDKLRAKLEDPDLSVVSCAVNVICELSRRNPTNFLPLAPNLFKVLTTTSNNWMLIKVVKLMSSLLQQEPRLARKLLEPLAHIINTTPAKSLMYECVHTVAIALQYTADNDGLQPTTVPSLVKLCAGKLREFVQDSDLNLRYLGLEGLVDLMKSHPKAVAQHKDLVQSCLVDDDVTIRLRALELLSGMVTAENVVEIVQKLMERLSTAEGQYRQSLVERIVQMCSKDNYVHFSQGHFSWYTSVLMDLAFVHNTSHSKLVADQLVNIVLRVPTVRNFAVRCLVAMLVDGRLVRECSSASSRKDEVGTKPTGPSFPVRQRAPSVVLDTVALNGTAGVVSGAMVDVVKSASWIVCQYIQLLVVPPKIEENAASQNWSEHEEKVLEHLGKGVASLGVCDSGTIINSFDLISELVDSLLSRQVLQHMPSGVQEVCTGEVVRLVLAHVQHVLSAIGEGKRLEGHGQVQRIAHKICSYLEDFTRSEHIEVQERALLSKQLLHEVGLGGTANPSQEGELAGLSPVGDESTAKIALAQICEQLEPLFNNPVMVVARNAQQCVEEPKKLDLSQPFLSTYAPASLPADDLASRSAIKVSFTGKQRGEFSSASGSKVLVTEPMSDAEKWLEKQEASHSDPVDALAQRLDAAAGLQSEVKENPRQGPFYLGASTPAVPQSSTSGLSLEDEPTKASKTSGLGMGLAFTSNLSSAQLLSKSDSPLVLQETMPAASGKRKTSKKSKSKSVPLTLENIQVGGSSPRGMETNSVRQVHAASASVENLLGIELETGVHPPNGTSSMNLLGESLGVVEENPTKSNSPKKKKKKKKKHKS